MTEDLGTPAALLGKKAPPLAWRGGYQGRIPGGGKDEGMSQRLPEEANGIPSKGSFEGRSLASLQTLAPAQLAEQSSVCQAPSSPLATGNESTWPWATGRCWCEGCKREHRGAGQTKRGLGCSGADKGLMLKVWSWEKL